MYRAWRDLGYAFEALLPGFVADRLALSRPALVVAALTLASSMIVAVRLPETHHPRVNMDEP